MTRETELAGSCIASRATSPRTSALRVLQAPEALVWQYAWLDRDRQTDRGEPQGQLAYIYIYIYIYVYPHLLESDVLEGVGACSLTRRVHRVAG